MGLRSSLLFELSRRRLPPPAVRTVDYGAYQDWRRSHLAASWSAFAAADLRGKEVLDFGCGDGPLSLYLANSQLPARIIGVDLDPIAVGRARAALAERPAPSSVEVEFRQGTVDRVPLDDCAVDFVVAFDCLEHVMDPLNILREWHRVLRPGGRCLLEWFPYKGPWGPHMEALIPVPWAHVVFGLGAHAN
jgi:2-polyprenyl-3-methyl-5-hydroxy-6-metoxy-1,4-benzoquinol methylase